MEYNQTKRRINEKVRLEEKIRKPPMWLVRLEEKITKPPMWLDLVSTLQPKLFLE